MVHGSESESGFRARVEVGVGVGVGVGIQDRGQVSEWGLMLRFKTKVRLGFWNRRQSQDSRQESRSRFDIGVGVRIGDPNSILKPNPTPILNLGPTIIPFSKPNYDPTFSPLLNPT